MAKKKEDKVPEDIDGELKSPKFGKPKTHTNTGYFLDVNEKERKADLQLYEPMSGTTILEGLQISNKVNLNDIEKGVVCEFQLDELIAPLSKKTVEYLKVQGITLDKIVQFELKEFKIIDENN